MLATYYDLWYIAKWGDGSFIDDGIRLATKLPNWGAPPTTHYELGVPLLGHSFRWRNVDGKLCFTGNCYTSTTRGKHNGTCVRPAQEVIGKHPERWLYTMRRVNQERFEAAKAKADKRVDDNIGYAWKNLPRYSMLLWLFRRLGLEDLFRETCSQHGEHWKFDMRELLDDLIRSPRRLWTDTVEGTHLKTRRLVDDGVVYSGTMKVGKIYV